MITFQQLSEEYDRSDAPWLDREEVPLLTGPQQCWRDNGAIIISNIIPTVLIERYKELWLEWHAVRRTLGLAIERPTGWASPTPYMHHREIRDLCLYPPLMQIMEDLMGTEMGLHLNLTGWISTERNAHQDTYLNPPFIKGWYCAAWIALDDVTEDAGPFEFVPGSHRWPVLTREKILAQCPPEEAASQNWPKTTERFVVPAVLAEVERRGARWERFLAKKGDVLIWHTNLVHRGSEPRVPGIWRKACIAHYSALNRRLDMPAVAVHDGQPYFVLHNPIDRRLS